MFRVLVGMVAGLLLGAVAIVAFVDFGGSPATTPQRQTSVLVAAQAVRAGSLLQPGDFAAREIPANQLPSGARPDTSQERGALIGAMVRRSMSEGEVISIDDVLRPGDRGFLAAVLQPGTRAVSVAVDSVSGEAGLIWPGDRVDIILTQTIEAADQSPAHRVAGETVLSNIRVIAVDQQLVQGGQASGLLENRTPASRTITLEVTPEDAARIAVATRLGKLQVVLRAAGTDAEQASASPPSNSSHLGPVVSRAPSNGAVPGRDAGTVWAGDVSRALGPDRSARNPEVRVFQGTRPSEAYKF